MKEEEIRKYAGLMQELGLTGLEFTQDNQVVRLERNVPVPTGLVRETIVTGTERAENTILNTAQNTAQPAAQSSDCISVKSPIVGVFYAAPAENADPFVNVGDRVEKGKTLCILEAMKLMNEIPAEVDGIIAEVCVANGQMVEFGTELFKIRKA